MATENKPANKPGNTPETKAASKPATSPTEKAKANEKAPGKAPAKPGFDAGPFGTPKAASEERGGLLSRFFHKREKTATRSGSRPAYGANESGVPTIVRKISKKEEQTTRLNEGLTELSSLMRCVGDQLDSDSKDRAAMRQAIEPLREFLSNYPDAAERSTKALEAIQSEVVGQRQSTDALVAKMSALPEALRELPAVGKQQVTILQGVLRNVEEHNRKLTGLLNTVETATARNAEAIDDLRELQKESLEVMTRSQQDTYREFDRRNGEQQKNLVAMMTRNNRHHAVLMVVFLIVTLCAVSVAALMTGKGGRPIEANNASHELPAGK